MNEYETSLYKGLKFFLRITKFCVRLTQCYTAHKTFAFVFGIFSCGNVFKYFSH